MDGKKNQQSAIQHNTRAKKKSLSASEDTHQSPAGLKAVGGGKDISGNISSQILHQSNVQEEEVTKATTLLFEHIEQQIGRADTKAQLTMAADALLTGALATLGKGVARNLLSTTAPVLDRLTDLLTILMFLALACSFLWALRVVNPHLRGSKRFTLMYFGKIAQMDEDEFIDTFRNQSLHDLSISALAQVHAKARIAQIKFTRARWSVNFLIVSLACWAVLQLLFAFS